MHCTLPASSVDQVDNALHSSCQFLDQVEHMENTLYSKLNPCWFCLDILQQYIKNILNKIKALCIIFPEVNSYPIPFVTSFVCSRYNLPEPFIELEFNS